MYIYVYEYIDCKICRVNYLMFCFDFFFCFMFKLFRRIIKRGCISIYKNLIMVNKDLIECVLMSNIYVYIYLIFI